MKSRRVAPRESSKRAVRARGRAGRGPSVRAEARTASRARPVARTASGKRGTGPVAADLSGRRPAGDAPRAEADLRLNADIVRNLETGLYVWKLEDREDERSFRLLAANPASERITGTPAGKLLGRTIGEAFPALLETDQPCLLREVVLTGESRDLGVVRSADPRAAATARAACAFALPDDCVAVSFEDVTERVRAEEALGLSERRHRELFEYAPLGIYRSARDGRLLAANATLARMLGYDSVEELLQRNIRDIYFGPAEREALIAHFGPAGTVADLEVLWKRRDGTPLPIQLNARAVRDASGEIAYFDGFVRDDSERSRAEAERRTLERERVEALDRLRLILDRMPIACIVIDTEFRYTYWNPAAERIFGYTGDEVRGRHPYEVIVPPSSRAAVEDMLRRVAQGDMTAHGTHENVTRDGRTIVCEWMNTPLRGPDGKFLGNLSMTQDVTERIRLEEQLRQAQKMEAVGRLAGGVAHDFNNLLTAILGYSDLALAELDEHEQQMRPKFEEIRKAGERAASLTHQLLAFSRRQVLQSRLLDLGLVIADVEKLLRRVIGEDVRLVTVVDPSAGRVLADPMQIQQVLMNLAINARDAMPQGGTLTLEVAGAMVDEADARAHADAKTGPHVMLAVTDTGTGMDTELLSHAFEPFFTTKEQGKGTGLGLSTVYGIIRQSGGHIRVRSEPGRGSRFEIYLPAAEEGEMAEAREGGTAERPRTGTETILIAEDEPSVRGLIREVLVSSGYHVLEGDDCDTVLAAARAHDGPIDLLITDIVMPGPGGHQLASLLRLERPSTRVLYISGYAGLAFGERSGLEPGSRLLQKPFAGQALLASVRETLDAPPGG